MRLFYSILLICSISLPLQSQENEDVLFIKRIHDFSLSNSSCYEWLDTLCQVAPGRLAGSDQYRDAEKYMTSVMQKMGLDKVWNQDCRVPVWNRGNTEQVVVWGSDKAKIELRCLALGNSIGTNGKHVEGEIIEVFSLDDVEKYGNKAKNKVVFFNRPMDAKQIRTFHAYGGAVDQRVHGASIAAKWGAKAVLVRSMTTLIDTVPHTGTLIYNDTLPKIPALAISTKDAELLSEMLKKETITAQVVSFAEIGGTTINRNIVGEIKGSEFPDTIILVGGHLDAWDVGAGAHDDGSGCVHSLEVLHTLKKLGYKPRHTIRCVLFANEENGLAGGRAYAEFANERDEFHLAALESDSGGFVPRGFSFDADSSVFNKYYRKVSEWLPVFESYDLHFKKGGSGADIGPLKDQKGLLIGLRVDSQRYFDYHHTANDRIEAVNKRELELGAASMTSLIYLIDKYGLE